MAKRNEENKQVSESKFLWTQWLEKLQQESWQLELLISGLALFGIYEAKPMVDELILGFRTNGHSGLGVLTSPLSMLLEAGWIIFFINLLVHVILRGLWIGAIGLRYVSKDIDYDSLNFSETFTTYLRKNVGEYDDFIERLERICSVLFAYTFLLFLLVMSLLIFLCEFVLIQSIDPTNQTLIFASLFFLLVGIVVFVDFISLGGIKRIKEENVSKVYMYIYKFYSYATLSFLYRPLIYNFIDDKYTKRLFFLSVPYIFIVLFHNGLFSSEAYPYYSSDKADDYGLYVSKMQYEDERVQWYDEANMKKQFNKHGIPRVTLSQFKVDKPYLEIFLRILGDDQYLLDEAEDVLPLKKSGFRIPLFSKSSYPDKILDSLVSSRVDATRDLRQNRRVLKKKLKKDPTLQPQVDALSSQIDSTIDHWKEIQKEYEKGKVEKIIAKTLEYNSLTIDGEDIRSDLECFKYRHPNFNERGLLCLYPTDSLAVGRHLLLSKRSIYNYRDKKQFIEEDPVPFFMTR